MLIIDKDRLKELKKKLRLEFCEEGDGCGELRSGVFFELEIEM